MSIFNIIKNHITILDVAQEYATLKRVGNYWKGCCPFHHEKTASFTISPHKEIFYCFGCHASGDVIAFVARAEQCSQIEAAKQLVERYSIELPKDEALSIQTGTTTQEKNRYGAICEIVAFWAHKQLLHSADIIAYLHNRSINDQSIKDYLLGYFPGGVRGIKSLILDAKEHNILSQDLIDICIIAEGRSMLYSPFEERILFPIRDHLGNVCGFGGRIYKKDDTRAKYYNTKENDFFIKGSLLFGLDKAKKAMQELETVYLVEGYTDCIAMNQAGFLNTVATLGTSCTAQHLKQLGRYAHTAYIVYDSDKAGHNAVLRLATLCWQVNMELYIVTLPTGFDPASYLATGNSIKNMLDSAQNIFTFYIQDIKNSFDRLPLSKKLENIRAMLEALAALDDDLKLDLLLQEASLKLNVDYRLLSREIDRIRSKEGYHFDRKGEAQPIFEEPADFQTIGLLEKELICSILNNVTVLDDRKAKYLATYLPQPFGGIVQRLYQTRTEESGDCFRFFWDSLDQKQQHCVSQLMLRQDIKEKEQQFDSLYGRWQRKQWKLIVSDIKLKLMQAMQQENHERVAFLLQEFTLLKQSMVLPNPEENK